ncbi:MAG: hypothetical protein MO847_07420, partial [Candidatus Protistobacter heckmanni]|nr:hypothetical protein [Candidatus Protistobacter heckmanni]
GFFAEKTAKGAFHAFILRSTFNISHYCGFKETIMSEVLQQREFGLVPPQDAARLSGLELLRGLLDGSLPSPPFAQVTDI